MTVEWLPGPVGRLERARAELARVLDSWLEVDGISLASIGPPQMRFGTAAGWGRGIRFLEEASTAVARYSQLVRTDASPDGDERRALTSNALGCVGRLATWFVIELDPPIDRTAVLAEADSYLQKVEAEDNGAAHATDAIAAMLEARLDLSGSARALSQVQSRRFAAEILAPLVAQAACLEWGDDGA